MVLTPGIETQATLVGGECSHHCATLANDQWPKWISRHLGGGGGEEGHSSSLKGSPSGLFPLLIITRGLIIDWYISKFQKKGEHDIYLRNSTAKNWPHSKVLEYITNFIAVAGRIDEKFIIAHTSAPESSFDWISYLLSLFYKLKKKRNTRTSLFFIHKGLAVIIGKFHFIIPRTQRVQTMRSILFWKGTFSNLTLTKVFIGGRLLFTFSLT